MAVSHTSAGFTGTVDQVAEAKRFNLATVPFRVLSSSDWAITPVTTQNLTAQVAAGTGQAYGVNDVTAAADTVVFAANATGANRQDVVVATFDWNAGTVSFGVIQGTASPPAINTTTTVDTTKINRIPGVRYDAVLALVTISNGQGALATSNIADIRVWGGQSGALYTGTENGSLLDCPQGTYLICQSPYGRLWRQSSSGGSGWVTTFPLQNLTVNGGWTVVSGHTPKAYVTTHGTVKFVGWFANGGAMTVNGSQTPITIPSNIPAPTVNQVVMLPYIDAGTAGYVIGTMHSNGSLTLDNGLGHSFGANTNFFLDSLEYHTSYGG